MLGLSNLGGLFGGGLSRLLDFFSFILFIDAHAHAHADKTCFLWCKKTSRFQRFTVISCMLSSYSGTELLWLALWRLQFTKQG